ncbi:MAG: acyl-CoA thioesterase [Acidiferrobacterales bacterium]
MTELPDKQDTSRESFSHWASVTLRFADLDTLGHVNSAVYGQYLSEGRTSFIGALLRRFNHTAMDFVLASVKIEYLNELRYPGNVEIGSSVLQLGNKSATLGHGLFKDETLVATAESVIVFVDMTTGKSVPIPDDVRRELERAGS